MELKGKQKRYLRSLAVNIKPVVQVGKGGISNEILTAIRVACEARELIKVSILQNSNVDPIELGEAVGEMGLNVVQIIGRNLVIFKASRRKENQRISREVKEIIR